MPEPCDGKLSCPVLRGERDRKVPALPGMRTKWSDKMSNKKRRTIFVFGSFFCGALLLCLFSTFQKKAIGAPIVIRGYFVPFVFGGISGGIIGFYISKIKEYNFVLKERVNTLESFLPICSSCKKIRKSNSDPKQMDSWVPIESYISAKTSSQFSHGICPECMKKLYGDILNNDD